MAKHLTPLGRNLIIGIVVLVIGGFLYFASQEMMGSDKKDGTSQSSKNLFSGLFNSSKSGDYDATLIVNTYCGFEPIVWGNGGLQGKEGSYFDKKFGLKLKIIIMDDFEACRAAFKNGDAQIAYCTLDAFPTETSAAGDMTDSRYFMLLNFSNGADAIVVNNTIKTVADLKGKSIAFSEGTAAHTLLLNTLETNGLNQSDIKFVKVLSGTEAASAFKAKQVDAAVVWAPDDEDCLAAIPGSKVLTSTKQANNLISDGLIAKKEWLDENKELSKNIVTAILWANSEVKYQDYAYKEGAKAFADAFGMGEDFALISSKKVNYATLADNANYFGFNPEYTGMNADQLYTRMSRLYSGIGLCKAPLAWAKVSYPSIIEELLENNTLDNEQGATKAKEFKAPTKELETKQAISDKKVVIEFPVNGYALDNEARNIIDREFVDIAKQFSGARVRVEGNTDNTGNADYNVSLSKKRAAAVVEYLVNVYGMDPNRFIVVGNGPKKAIQDGIRGDSREYRTTDFQLISE